MKSFPTPRAVPPVCGHSPKKLQKGDLNWRRNQQRQHREREESRVARVIEINDDSPQIDFTASPVVGSKEIGKFRQLIALGRGYWYLPCLIVVVAVILWVIMK